MVKGGGYNEIWHFGEENYPVLKKLIETRIKLRDYTLSLAKDAHENGAPMMRPMFFEFPQDELCYTLWDQYMYGSDILFAPIYNEGQTERTVYLPEGSWIRVGNRENDKCEYTGGQTVAVKADVSEYIAFVRKGSEVIKAFDGE
mgnify:FL=1